MRTISLTRSREPRLHVETPLGIVNIRAGLTDFHGQRVDSIEVIPNRYAGEPTVELNGYANTRLVERTEPTAPGPERIGVDLLDTEPRTPERLRAAVDIGELVLCMAETNEGATPEEVAELVDALPNSSLAELVALVIEGIRA